MMGGQVQIFQIFQEVRTFRANRLLKSVLWKMTVLPRPLRGRCVEASGWNRHPPRRRRVTAPSSGALR